MKRLVLVLLSLLFFICFPTYAHADDPWTIENFYSSIAIQQSGVVTVAETISVDFHTTPQYGIYRDIPYEYDSNGKQVYTQIDITKVLQNNIPAQYTTSQTNGYEEIKIGDPNKLIDGRNVYTIVYTATGILKNVGNYDELYWNVTGNDWSVPIQKAEATVTAPKQGIAKVVCYQGFTGSQAQCASNISSSTVASFATTDNLQEQEGMTVAVNYKKGLVPLLVSTPPQPYWLKLFELPAVIPLVAIILLGVGVIIGLWYKNGRDYWFENVLFGTKDQKGKTKPTGAHETISVEFTPPEKLRPAEIGVLMDERADTLDVTSTIIDLATRGYLTITEVPKKWMFGKVDYLLTKTSPKKSKVELLQYEQLLLDKLFYKRRQVKLSSLKTTFYKDLKEVKTALYDDVVSKNLFERSPEKVRQQYFTIAVILLVGGIAWLFFGYSTNITLIGSSGLGCAVMSVVWLFMARFMPRKTAYGRECYRRSKGYYLFINSAEKYRQRYFEKQDMFNDVLSYAIVFGLTKKFAKQMDKLGVKPKQTNWYIGQQPFATGVFIGNIDMFSNSLSTAMASAPSQSGGFSGGSSGGGFGGGGGGSW